ncbi:eosinophil peroxidase-like isoform X1 [Oxyura jamaicensis]|uniref:eosinophil peroxidase-like isoform X1 n=1 Tax=Oxyura jamaicensis TaxID=8884 RepID=UPI0015A5AA92|nr:eosinophil peroxidase-like isoform X1 [Oxyura jamaicensis]
MNFAEMEGIKLIVTLLGVIITLCLAGPLDSSLTQHSKGLSDSSLLSSINEAKQLVDAAYLHARKSLKQKLEEKVASPMDFLKHLKEPVGRTRSAVRAANYLETTLKLLKGKLQLPGKGRFNVTDLLDRKQKEMISRETGCDYQIHSIKCPEDNIYRTITGECNNRKHSHLGASNHAFARWLPAAYEDGVSVPRGVSEGKLYNGFPLPLVRKVSNEIARTGNENVTQDQELSLFFMHWGQWVNHDIDLAPSSGAGANPDLHCETDCTFKSPCFPIKFPPDDPRVLRSNSCMPFIQSASVCNPRTFTREQINAVSSFIDASMVYGSEDSVAKSLRNQTNRMGLLAVNQNFTDAGLELLPFENKTKSVCVLTNKTMNIPCFKAGDKRVTENLGLSALHTIFLREHNRLVTKLGKLNPHWDGEKLYQESRKIIVAMTQIITYRDYLPLVLAKETNRWIPLYSGYNETVDPSVSNVFSLAFRFGHTSVQPFVSRLDDSFQPMGSLSHVPLHLTFCASWRIITEGGIDPLIRGMVVDHAKLMKQNQLLVEELQNHLFEQTAVMGLDLAALNLQRGRDHGLPGYNAWRHFCGLSQPQSIEELSEVLGNSKLAKKFMDLYGTPDNIDLWIGAIAEPLIPQGRVGPLLACIIGTQFRNLRDGDRFWWEKPGVFTLQQLHALKKVSLSKVICDNTHIKKLPQDMFQASTYPENFIDCHEIDMLNLSAWKDEPESGRKGIQGTSLVSQKYEI